MLSKRGLIFFNVVLCVSGCFVLCLYWAGLLCCVCVCVCGECVLLLLLKVCVCVFLPCDFVLACIVIAGVPLVR